MTTADPFRSALPPSPSAVEVAEERDRLARRALAGDEEAEVALDQLLREQDREAEW